MAKRDFLVNIDLNKNQLLNARLQNLATDPSLSVNDVGYLYYNTATSQVGIWTSAAWLRLVDDTNNQTIAGLKTFSNAVSITDATASTTTTTGALKVSGGVGIVGNLNVGGDFVLTGNLTVNGTTTTINSTVTSIDDPVIVLGEYLAVEDALDRGVIFKHGTTTTPVDGFFGWSRSRASFIFTLDNTTGVPGTGTFGQLLVTQDGDTNVLITPTYIDSPEVRADSFIHAAVSSNSYVILAGGGTSALSNFVSTTIPSTITIPTGYTVPAITINQNSTSTTSGGMTINTSGGVPLVLNNTSSTTAIAEFKYAGNTTGSIYSDGATFRSLSLINDASYGDLGTLTITTNDVESTSNGIYINMYTTGTPIVIKNHLTGSNLFEFESVNIVDSSGYISSQGVIHARGFVYETNPSASALLTANGGILLLSEIPGALKYSEVIQGDGIVKGFSIPHNFGTTDIIMEVYSSGGHSVDVLKLVTDTDTAYIEFNTAPATGTSYRVVVMA